MTGYAGSWDYVRTPQSPQKAPHIPLKNRFRLPWKSSVRVPSNSSQHAQNSCERVGLCFSVGYVWIGVGFTGTLGFAFLCRISSYQFQLAMYVLCMSNVCYVAYLAVLRIQISFILVSRIRFNDTDPDPGSKKSAKIKENFHKNQPKSLEYHKLFSKLLNFCLLTNIYPINKKTDHISEKHIFFYRK